MRGLKRIRLNGAAVMVLNGGLAAYSAAQSFNIDLDVGVGDPGIGNGAPSSSFGGAAGQPGYWNRLGFGGVPVPIAGLDGNPTAVIMDASYHGAPSFGGGFAFTGNTGDYALLLNDAADVGTIVQGGQLTYAFSGLAPGTYDVFTYAANRAGIAIDTPVTIPNANPGVEIVSGPMPGNELQHLVTHSIHRVDVDASGAFQIFLSQPPWMNTSMNVNGFQVAMVPEPSTIAFVASALLWCLYVRRRSPLGCNPDTPKRGK